MLSTSPALDALIAEAAQSPVGSGGVAFLPFLAEDPARIFHGLGAFATQFAFNGPVHGLLRWATGGIAPATAACQALLAAAMVFGCLRFHPRRNPRFFDDPA